MLVKIFRLWKLCICSIAAFLVFGFAGVCLAQDNPPDAPLPTNQSSDSGQASGREGKFAFVELVRTKSLVFPDLAYNSTRLTPWQKFELASNNTVGLSNIGVVILSAAYGQAVDTPTGYGEGGEAFGKRFGADLARSASDNLFGTFMIASAFHEDPRFFVRRHLSFAQTVKYAAVRVVVTRTDSGDSTVNLATLLGPLASEALANTYYPEGSRDAASTFYRYGSDIAWKFGGNFFRQYWPTINKKLRILPPAGNTPH